MASGNAVTKIDRLKGIVNELKKDQENGQNESPTVAHDNLHLLQPVTSSKDNRLSVQLDHYKQSQLLVDTTGSLLQQSLLKSKSIVVIKDHNHQNVHSNKHITWTTDSEDNKVAELKIMVLNEKVFGQAMLKIKLVPGS